MFYVKGLSANYKALDKWKGLLRLCFLLHPWSPEHQGAEPRVGARDKPPGGPRGGISFPRQVGGTGHGEAASWPMLLWGSLELLSPRREPSLESSDCPRTAPGWSLPPAPQSQFRPRESPKPWICHLGGVKALVTDTPGSDSPLLVSQLGEPTSGKSSL